jgi:hypothetical protein
MNTLYIGPGGNYVNKLKDFVAAHPELNGKVGDIDVRHDSWCAIYKNQLCNCDPDLEIRKGEERD